MKLKKVATITVLGVLLSSVPAVQAQQEISVYVNGQKLQFETPPTIIDGNTLVPMRTLFEALGAEVSWDNNTKTATGEKTGVLVSVTIGEQYILRCTVNIPIEVPAMIINENTMIPLRVVSEAFGLSVNWSESDNSIYMFDTGAIKCIPWNDKYVYYGEGDNNTANGYGILYDIETKKPYKIGYFKNDVITKGSLKGDYISFIGEFNSEGSPLYGTMYYMETNDTAEDDPEYYTGEIKDFMPNGYGVLTFRNGNVYSGNFNDGYKNGEGIFTFPNGTYYKGTWINDSLNGEGVFYDAPSNIAFYGNFINSGFNGVVTIYDNNNDIYAYAYYENGEFKNMLGYDFNGSN